jgi:hypothetical protein
MATVKAKAEITMFNVKDVKSVTKYYLLQSSTSSVPSKPTSNPPGGNWITTEPSYTTGSTNTLYFVDLTIMSDGSFSYSAVSKSSSYEAAKAAYNKAVSAESSANSANSKINNLKVGGRNLYRGTKDFSGNWVNKHGWTEDGTYDGLTVRKKSSPWGVLCQKINVNQSDVYTCSLYVKTDTLNNFQMYPNLGGTGLKYNILSKDTSVTEINTWKRIWMTIEVTEDGVMQFGVEPTNIGGNVWICGLKLEKGNKATDWTPAPEDLETRVTNAETQITSNKEAIDLRATKTEVTTAKNDAIAAAEKYSDTQLTTKADAITSTVTTLSKDYNGYKQSSTTAIQNAQGWQLNWDKILNGKEANTNKHTDYIIFKNGTMSLGDSSSSKSLEISNETVDVKNGDDIVASFGDEIVLGNESNNSYYMKASGFSFNFYNDRGDSIACIADGGARFGHFVSMPDGELDEDQLTYYKQGYMRINGSTGLQWMARPITGYGDNSEANKKQYFYDNPIELFRVSLGYMENVSTGSTNGTRYEYIPSSNVYVNGNVDCSSLKISGNAVINGTLRIPGFGEDGNVKNYIDNLNQIVWQSLQNAYRTNYGQQYNTSIPLLINGNSLGLATAQLILEYNNSYIRFRNDGSSFYIMNGNASSWTNYITFQSTGAVVVPNTLKVPTQLYIPYATKASTTSAANAYISADGNGVLAKTSKTSSRRFKDSITPELDEDLNPEHLYDVDVIQFKYKKDYFTNEDDIRYRKNMIGLIAEDVYDKYKIAADWHVDGDSGEVLVDGWNEQYIIPALLKLIQNQHKELQEQRKEIDQLKETVGILMKDYKERQSK